ncbi:MAG: hypothetical protein KAU14_08320, partial [Thermoplasmata archaeon]|nr:hypothetical protein [Thermoplasmata archaeon]
NKDDENNLTLYIYGEYNDTSSPGEPVHEYAYKRINVTKPNNPPEPVAWVAVDGNWTWTNLSKENDVTFIVEGGEGLILWFDASHSWDPDGDNITRFAWDLDGNNKFGESGETEENQSKPVTAREEPWELGLKVYDERGKECTQSLDFTIRIQSPERKPDLTVGEIKHENMNTNKQNYEKGDVIVVQPKIKNIGDNSTEGRGPFWVLIEYSTDGGDSYSTLADYKITDAIPGPSGFRLGTYNWDTEGQEFPVGQYILRVTADYNNSIDEEDEDNNDNTTNIINLEESPTSGSPDLSIESVKAERTTAYILQDVNITVTIKNEGNGDALTVDVHYEIDGVFILFDSIELVPAGGNASITFVFSGDVEKDYVLTFKAKDNEVQVGTTESVTIQVMKKTHPNGNGNGENGNGDKKKDGGGFIPGFELLPMVGAVLATALLFGIRKRH